MKSRHNAEVRFFLNISRQENDYAKIMEFISEFKKQGSTNPELDAFNKLMEER